MWYQALHPEEQEVIEQPKGANRMYSIGEWIRVASWTYKDFVGYILERDDTTKKYKVQLVKNKYGNKFDTVLDLHEDEIYPADLEDGFDTSFLHDLAIDWCLVNKQEDYFYQLLKEKGGNDDDVE
jgi:hypothetical protein